jgi:K+-sensing histidine kinase KdpD
VFLLTRTARYGIAALIVAIAAALLLTLAPILVEVAPLLLFLLPVIPAASYRGLGVGPLATALSAPLGDHLFIYDDWRI